MVQIKMKIVTTMTSMTFKHLNQLQSLNLCHLRKGQMLEEQLQIGPVPQPHMHIQSNSIQQKHAQQKIRRGLRARDES